jgi:peptidoglycan hydrolase CwlO-like protein
MADDYTLKDVVHLLDALAGSTKAGFDRVENEVGALKPEMHRLQADVERLDGSVSAARADSQSLRADSQSLRMEMRAGFERLDKKIDQSISRIADRVTAFESRPS